MGKLPKPKEMRKIFYSPRINEKDLNDMLEFGISYSINSRLQSINNNNMDSFLNKAIIKLKELGYSSSKINYIIRNRMNRIKLGVESYRICRRCKI